MSKLAVDHVLRPELPWRSPEQALTECGLVPISFPTITRDELADRWNTLGRQRTAMTVCMTCFNTSQTWRTWEQDPLDAIERAIKLEPSHRVYMDIENLRPTRPTPVSPLRTELRAMAILVERHREEFDGIVTGLGQVASLDQQRVKRRAEEARARREKRRGL